MSLQNKMIKHFLSGLSLAFSSFVLLVIGFFSPLELRAASSTEMAPLIEIPSRVEISQKEELYLGQIVIVRNGTPDLIKLLDECLVLADAKALILKPQIKTDTLIQCYRESVSQNSAIRKLNPRLKLPQEVTVDFSKGFISKAETERRVINVLNSQCPECEYRVSIISLPILDSRKWSMDLGNLPDRGGLMIPIIEENSSANKKWISGQISVQKLTPVLSRTVSQGERLNSTDIKYVLKDMTGATQNGLRGEDIQGLVANRYLPAGQPILAADVHREPLVKKGQILKAIAGGLNYEVSLSVEALENGFDGEFLKVKATESTRNFSGKLDAQGVVRIQ